MYIRLGGTAAVVIAFTALAHWPGRAAAQLPDCELIDTALKIAAPGGCIGKPLYGQIGAGQGDAATPWSSVYLVKRDPARAIRRGRQLFQR